MTEEASKKKRTLDEVNVNDRAQMFQEVANHIKLNHLRLFLDNLREIEDLELKMEKLKRENSKLLERYPDLITFESHQEKWFRKSMWNIKTDEGFKRVFGPTQEKAEKSYFAKKELEKKNAEKNKQANKKLKEEQ